MLAGQCQPWMVMRHALSFLLTAVLVAAPPPEEGASQRALHLQSFEQVWSTVAQRHPDPTLGGLDWQKVHDELKPKVEQAGSPEAVRAVLTDMLSRLKQSHFGILPAEVFTDLQSATKSSGSPGLDLRYLDGKALITEVQTGSPAAKAGVKPGWQLIKVSGKEVAPILQKLGARFQASTGLSLFLSRAVMSLLQGPVAETVEADFHDGTKVVHVTLGLAAPRGRVIALGNMPPMPVWVEHSALPSGVRYVRFSSWFEPETIAEAFRASLREGGPVKGFILDLRGNPGGIGGMAMGAAGWFTEQSGKKLGTMALRGTSLKFVVSPRPEPYLGPIAILVDGCTASTSEIFAGGMQDLKRARIFGSQSAGMALPSVFERLPNGDGFQYAIANYISDGGRSLEGHGVIPDESVIPTQRDLLAGRDPILDHALAWILRSAH